MVFQADFLGMVALFAITHSIASGVFLLFYRGHQRRSARYLGAVQISGAMVLLSSLLTTTNLFQIAPNLSGVPYPFVFLSGFFTLLYVESLLKREIFEQRRLLFWIAGPLAGFVLALPFFAASPEEQRAYISYIAEHHDYPDYDWLIWGAGMLYNWAILVVALVKIRQYRRALEEELSDTQGVFLTGLKWQIALYALCWLAVTVVSLLSYGRFAVEVSIKLSALLPALFLFVTAYTFLFRLVDSRPQSVRENLLKDSIDDRRLAEEYRTLQQEMTENRHYLDPDLTLPDLAERSSFYRNELSEIINRGAGESFFHFVNRYRVEHFSRLLGENQTENILELAFRSGFNSKGAFYNAFKRITGCTPRQYQNQQTSPYRC